MQTDGWLPGQYSAPCAGVFARKKAKERKQRRAALAAAQDSVVKAAMTAYLYDGGDPIRQRELDLARNAACAALAKLEGK